MSATDLMSSFRKPLYVNPNGQLTLKRDQIKSMETAMLCEHFAHWLTSVTEKPLRTDPDGFCDDLSTGVALCKLLTMLPQSGVTKFHDVPSDRGVPLDSWKSLENMSAFHQACAKTLALPVTFGSEDLTSYKNPSKVCSSLLFLVHTATKNGVGIKELAEDPELSDRMKAVDDAAEASMETPQPPAAQSAEGLSWWQQLLVRFGLGDWLEMFDMAKLKAYVEQLRAQLAERATQMQADADKSRESFRSKVLESTASFKDKLPDSIKSKLG